MQVTLTIQLGTWIELRMLAAAELNAPRVPRSSDALVVSILQGITSDSTEVNDTLAAFIQKLSTAPTPPPPPPPTPLIGQPPAAWDGARLVAVWDMGAVPDWYRSQGYDGSDSAIAYCALTTLWIGPDWPQGSLEGGLYAQRQAMADLASAHIEAMRPSLDPATVAVVNDGPDRLGHRCALVTASALGIPTGDTVPD